MSSQRPCGSWRPEVAIRPGYNNNDELYVIPQRKKIPGKDYNTAMDGSSEVSLAIAVIKRAYRTQTITPTQRTQLESIVSESVQNLAVSLNETVLNNDMETDDIQDTTPSLQTPPRMSILTLGKDTREQTVLSTALQDCIDSNKSVQSLSERYRERYGRDWTKTNNTYTVDDDGSNKNYNNNSISDSLPSCRTLLSSSINNPEVIALKAVIAETQTQLDQIRDIKSKTKLQLLSMIEATCDNKEPFISNTQLLNAMTEEERVLCQRAGELRAKLAGVMGKLDRLQRQPQ